MNPLRQVVILAGGKGTRLGTLTAEAPKPLLPIVDGLSVLDLLIEKASAQGYGRILLLAGYLGDQLTDRYHHRTVGGAELSVLREPEPRGTAGALAFAADHLDQSFLLMNGDSIFDINYRAFEPALRGDSVGALALRRVEDASRFGSVTLAHGKIEEFREKNGRAEPALINGGVYALRRAILERIGQTPSSLETAIFPTLAAEGKLAGQVFNDYFIDVGLPETLALAKAELGAWRRRPIAFLDRDGVLNVDRGWPHLPSELEWIDGAKEAVRLLNEYGFHVIVVSNQAGVARGLYKEAQIGVFQAALVHDLALAGAHIDAFYYCPFHPQAVVEAYRMDSPDRKPNPGMLLKAFAAWPSRKEGSFLVGDKRSDVDAACSAGIPGYLFEGGSLLDFVSRLPQVKEKQSIVPGG